MNFVSKYPADYVPGVTVDYYIFGANQLARIGDWAEKFLMEIYPKLGKCPTCGLNLPGREYMILRDIYWCIWCPAYHDYFTPINPQLFAPYSEEFRKRYITAIMNYIEGNAAKGNYARNIDYAALGIVKK